jgi:protein SCO1/2
VKLRGIVLLATLAGIPARAHAAPRASTGVTPAVAAVDIDEKLGARVPLDLAFTTSDGRRVHLGDVVDGRHPVALVLAYFRCPMLCDLVLARLSHTMHELGWIPGRDYLGLTVSIDPKDTPATARLKQTAVLQAVGQAGPAAVAGWPFLVGDEASSRALAGSVGFGYAYDPRSEQFAHPAVAVILTPDGRVSRYLYGVDFRLLDVRLALTEAANGRVGSIVDRALLTCFRYDPSARRYGFYVSAMLKGGGAIVLFAVGTFLTVLWRRDVRRTSSSRSTERDS